MPSRLVHEELIFLRFYKYTHGDASMIRIFDIKIVNQLMTCAEHYIIGKKRINLNSDQRRNIVNDNSMFALTDIVYMNYSDNYIVNYCK